MSERCGRRSGRRTKARIGRKARGIAAFALFAAWAALCQVQQALAAGVTEAPAAAAVADRRFDVPPGPLAGALESFRNVTGVQVDVEATPEALATFASPGCVGVMTDDQALTALLRGTGLTASIARGTASIRFSYSESVAVETSAPAAVSLSLPKFQGALLDTPQSIDVVSAEILEQQQATTLQQALRNVPGISLAAGEGGFQGDALTIRGFNARGDLHLDGMRDFGSYYRDPFAVEEVQVVKGPSGMAFGRGGTGGVVNQATKLPRLERFGDVQTEVGTDRTRRLTLDVSEPLERLGRGAALRVAATAHEGGVAGRDVTEQSRVGIAPSLSFGLGTRTRLTLAHLHQAADDVPDYGVPWAFHGPADVPRGSYYGFADGSYLRTDVDVSTVKVEHDFAGGLLLRNQLRRASNTRTARITQPRLPGGVTPDTPWQDIVVTRNQVDAQSEETLLQNQLDVVHSFTAGRVRHDVVAGIEVAREKSSPTRRAWDDVPGTPLLDPDPSDAFAGTSRITSDVDVDATTLAVYAIDTIHVTPRLSLVAGLRWDRFDVDYVNRAPTLVELDSRDEATTWRAAVAYAPRDNGNLYLSAATSFNPSAEALALSATTADTPPERNRSLEVGTKWSLGGGRLALRGAVFETVKTAAREADPNDPLRQVLSGEHRVRGAEVEIDGRVADRWHLMAGYSWMDGEVVESKANRLLEGEPLANVPRHTFSAWSTHDLPARVQVGWGLRHVSSRSASSTSPRDPVTGRLREVPGFWTADAMVARPLGDRWSLQLNLDNLADERYFEQVHNGHVVPGEARSATLGVKFAWPAGARP